METENKDGRNGDGVASFEKLTKELFDRSTESLDGETRSKLTRARRRALGALERPALVPPWLLGRPAAVASAVMLATFSGLLVWQSGDDDARAIQTVAASTDIELLLSEEDLDMLEELEFYAWLEEQPEIEIPETESDSIG